MDLFKDFRNDKIYLKDIYLKISKKTNIYLKDLETCDEVPKNLKKSFCGRDPVENPIYLKNYLNEIEIYSKKFI